MTTYNHEKYVAQAIDSILMQKTDFPYEVVIGEDCSPDGTREIVRKYQRERPDIVRTFLPEHNVGAHENFRQVSGRARGKYVAILEGDDYWLSPEKLQVQADLLDGHPETAVCGHQVLIVEEGRAPIEDPDLQTGFYNLDELLRWNFIPTCTVMYRWSLFRGFPDWFAQLKMGDWPMHMLMARYGNIAFLRETMGAYRRHPQGVWSGKGEIYSLQARIELFQHVGEALDPKYEPIVRERLFTLHHWLALEYIAAGDLPAARGIFRQSLALPGALEHLRAKCSMALQTCTPALYQSLRKLKRAFR
jgi:glycosyltransferase involved in cell wall biosynthesis